MRLLTAAAVGGALALPGCAAPPTPAFAERILPPPNLLPVVEVGTAKPADELPMPRPVEGEPPPTVGPLTLQDALRIGDENNPRLRQMAARVDIARAGRVVAFAEFLPTASVIGRHIQGTPSSTPFSLPTLPTVVGNVAFGGSSDSFTTAELHVQATVYDFGRSPARYGQAVAALDIAALQFQRARQTVAFDVTVAYLTVRRDRALRVIAEAAVRRAEVVLRDARNFLKRGTGLRNDVLRTEVLVAEARLALVRARTAEETAIAALNQVLGVRAAGPVAADNLVTDEATDICLADALRLAVANRQEFAVAVKAVASARLGTEFARADFLPKVVAGMDGTNQGARDRPTTSLLSGGVGIEMGLFEGGRRFGRLQGARAEVALAIAQGQEVCDRIAFEVEASWLSIADARERVRLARTDLTGATENLRVVRRQFATGEATPTDVVDAELALVRGQENEATAWYDYQTAVARLAYAVGVEPAALQRGCPAPTE